MSTKLKQDDENNLKLNLIASGSRQKLAMIFNTDWRRTNQEGLNQTGVSTLVGRWHDKTNHFKTKSQVTWSGFELAL